MPSKLTVAASAAAVVLAMAPAASGAPFARDAEQCISLGKGALGFNSSEITIYTNKPAGTYLTVDDGHVRASGRPTYENQTMFEFFNCSYTAPPTLGKGSVLTYQGYIKSPDGNCVTVNTLNSQNVPVRTEPCSFSSQSSLGNVEANQHFQFQLDSFYYYYSADFLGNLAGPVNASDFGAGGNYHFSINEKALMVSYEADSPQTGKFSEMLFGQLGDQYKPTTRTMPNCTLVKSGSVELVNTKTGETQPVTAGYTAAFPYGYSPLLNGTGNGEFSFYQCDSVYMGYESDDNNSYGHFGSNAYGQRCFSVQSGGDLNDYLIETPASGDEVYQPPCSLDDNSSQDAIYFHLAKTSDGYEINYLGAPASANAEEYGWQTYKDPQQTDGTTVVEVDPSSTDYKLCFTN